MFFVDGKHEGVQLVGSNNFRRRCIELSKKTNTIYNNMSLYKQRIGNAKHTQQSNVQNVEAHLNDHQANNAAPVKRKYSLLTDSCLDSLLHCSSIGSILFQKNKSLTIHLLLS